MLHDYGIQDKAASAVLLLHGFMGTGEDWQPLAQSLCAFHRLLCPDLPGHGKAPAPLETVDMGMEATVAGLIRLLDREGVSKCALAGYSMGGRVALHLALEHPHRFSCLVLESASPGIATDEERRERRTRDESLARQLEMMQGSSPEYRAFLEAWYEQPVFASLKKRPALSALLVRRRVTNIPAALAASLRGLGAGTQPDAGPRLAHLEMPVLLIAGKEDAKYAHLAQEMKNRIITADLAILEGCGHCPHEEDPEAFASMFRSFLTKHNR